jgi:membrane-associated HD superfamily phosphohydrolase
MDTKQNQFKTDIDLSQLNSLSKEYENTLTKYDVLSKEFVQYVKANPNSSLATDAQMNTYKSQLEDLNEQLVQLNATILSTIQKLYPTLEQNISSENVEAQQVKNRYDALLLEKDIIKREKEQIQSIQVNTMNTNLLLEKNRSIYAILLFFALAILAVIIYIFSSAMTSSPNGMMGGYAKKNYFLLAVLFISLFFVARYLS